MKVGTALTWICSITAATTGAFGQQTGPTDRIAPEESLAGCITNLGLCPSEPCNVTDDIIFSRRESIAYCPDGFHQNAGSPSIPCHVEEVEGLHGKTPIEIGFLVTVSELEETNRTHLTPFGSTLARIRTNNIASGPCNTLFKVASNLDRGAIASLTTSGTTARCEQPIYCTEGFPVPPSNSSVVPQTTPPSDAKTSSGEMSIVPRLLAIFLSSVTGIYYSV